MDIFETLADWLIKFFVWGSCFLVLYLVAAVLEWIFRGKSSLIEFSMLFTHPELFQEPKEELLPAEPTTPIPPPPENEALLDYFDRKNRRAAKAFPGKIARFRRDVAEGRIPNLESLMKTRRYEFVNPIPYFVEGYAEVDCIRLVSTANNAIAQDPDFPVAPWFVFDDVENAVLEIFDPAIVAQYDLYALLLQGWYEKTRMKTVAAALRKRYSAETD